MLLIPMSFTENSSLPGYAAFCYADAQQAEQLQDMLPTWTTGAVFVLTDDSLLRFFSGTGAIMPPEQVRAAESIPDASCALTAQEMLSALHKKGISVTGLAKTMNVSRPTIYHWLEGQAPLNSAEDRLLNLYRSLSSLSDAEIALLEKTWLRTLVGDESLYQLLTADVLDREKIDRALSAIRPLMQKMIAQNDRPRKSLAECVAEMKEIGVPRVPGWDEMPAVGKERIGSEDDDV